MSSQPASGTWFVDAKAANLTVLAVLRQHVPGTSWKVCRQWLSQRRVLVNDVLCVHEARRVAPGDRLTLLGDSAPPLPQTVLIRFVNEAVVVVEKPSGVVSVRRPEEAHWPDQKKQLAPTLDELTQRTLFDRERGKERRPLSLPPLWRVQRLDRETSGLVVFARTKAAADQLIPQFAAHTVERCYLAAILGRMVATKLDSPLVRDRGDGLRGIARPGETGEHAVTHVRPLDMRGPYQRIECRLETGRTHQIRIHLAEAGTPLCGEPTYLRRRDGTAIDDRSGAPRLALHATVLSFHHPTTGERLSFHSEWPADLQNWWDRLPDNP